MVGFFFGHFLQRRSQIILGRCLRDLRVGLARRRRRNRHALESLGAWKAAVAVTGEQNRRIRVGMRRQCVVDSLTNLLIHHCLLEVENDPSMRDAFQRIDAENLNLRNFADMNPPRPFPGRRRRR
ncbi:uncharacterized protein LOC120189728 [Hibiscus syriacus]|uniref:uncharacterized protein LOC120189728 n=1 Tax=Hibiscus syriacus TaxID=106335 RepID=UPI001923D776|nr:uncharacterized protein LOC120189728 [Hibiscus syriacus]